ncbi:hypothetical protein CBER1_07742 [Cercospora berteroae]|uniref:DUF6590 domain-containing protein n=1 Tax=Cercospora berteroae TaxID=357750 RepID=A0A2S6BSR8_9PEZI|nr:hypothetical protein CBER1_07742 [Cercospora berteroae]
MDGGSEVLGERESEGKTHKETPGLAEISAILQDLEDDLQEGERTEENEQLFTEEDEDFREMAERLKSIADVIDCLFRTTNSQFDRILLFHSAKMTDNQSWLTEQQAIDKGKCRAIQRPQSLKDAIDSAIQEAGRNAQDRLSESDLRQRHNPYGPHVVFLPSEYQQMKIHQEEKERMSSSLKQREPPIYQMFKSVSVTNERFKFRPPDFFRQVRVFAVLHESIVVESHESHKADSLDPLGEEGRVETISRFVVIEEAHAWADHFTVLPILSYGGQGIAAESAVEEDHGIIHSGRKPPEPTSFELAGHSRSQMLPKAIRISLKDRRQHFRPTMRIDYGQPKRVPFTVGARDIGMVHGDSRNILIAQFQLVQNRRSREGSRRQDQVAKGENEQKRPRTEEPLGFGSVESLTLSRLSISPISSEASSVKSSETDVDIDRKESLGDTLYCEQQNISNEDRYDKGPPDEEAATITDDEDEFDSDSDSDGGLVMSRRKPPAKTLPIQKERRGIGSFD